MSAMLTARREFLFTSPACGGGRRPKAGGWGNFTALAQEHAPSPTLPRLRGRELRRMRD